MGIDDSGEVTALVGLDGFVVRAQVHDGDQWWLAVESAVGGGSQQPGSVDVL